VSAIEQVFVLFTQVLLSVNILQGWSTWLPCKCGVWCRYQCGNTVHRIHHWQGKL